jgi:hypothetical protein
MFIENQQPAIQTKIEQPFGGFFQQNKSATANREEKILNKPWSQQAGGWIHFCMKWLRTLKSFQIFKIEIEKSKTYSCLSIGTTLIQIQSG